MRHNDPRIPPRRILRLNPITSVLAVVLAMAACDGGGDGGPTAPSNRALTASFTSTCTDLACTFSGSASNDSDGSITSYAWDFGDGASGTGASATHTYAAAATYAVRLTVTDNQGSTGTQAQEVTVVATVNQSPVASFTSSCTDLDCSFDASGSSDPDGSVASYACDFGDGATGTGPTASHSYGAAGTYAMVLTAPGWVLTIAW